MKNKGKGLKRAELSRRYRRETPSRDSARYDTYRKRLCPRVRRRQAPPEHAHFSAAIAEALRTTKQPCTLRQWVVRLRQLGFGDYGTVHLACLPRFMREPRECEKPFVLKRFKPFTLRKPERRESFDAEVEALKRIRTAMDAGRFPRDGAPRIFESFVCKRRAGDYGLLLVSLGGAETLRQRLEGNRITPRELKSALRQVATLLVSLMRNGIYHGDLHAANILEQRGQRNKWMIIDFGASETRRAPARAVDNDLLGLLELSLGDTKNPALLEVLEQAKRDVRTYGIRRYSQM